MAIASELYRWGPSKLKSELRLLKFIYSEKATKFCEILSLSYVVPVKCKVKISQNFVAFSEYMNFIIFNIYDSKNTYLVKTQLYECSQFCQK